MSRGLYSSSGEIQPWAVLRRLANQTVASGVSTVVVFDDEAQGDDWNLWTAGSIVRVDRPGIWEFKAHVIFDAGGTGTRRVRFLLGGGVSAFAPVTVAGIASSQGVVAVGVRQFALNEFLEVQLDQNSGGDIPIRAELYVNFWSRRPGPAIPI